MRYGWIVPVLGALVYLFVYIFRSSHNVVTAMIYTAGGAVVGYLVSCLIGRIAFRKR